MRSLTVFIIAFILTVLALSLFYYKVHYLEFPTSPDKTYNSWYIEAKFEIEPENKYRIADKPILLRFKLPKETSNLAIVDENFISRGFGSETTTTKSGNRYIEFSKRNSNRKETIFYRAIAYELGSPAENKSTKLRPIANSAYSIVNRPAQIEETDESFYEAIDGLISLANQKSNGKKTFIREMVKQVKDPNSSEVAIIQDKLAGKSRPDLISVAAILIEASGIPVRIVNGLQLSEDERHAHFHRMIEVYVEQKWQGVNFETLEFGTPKNFLPWWTGKSTDFYSLEGIEKIDSSVSLRKNTDNSLTRAIWKSGKLAKFLLKYSFFNFPLDAQLVFKLLLMVPLGGLVIAFMRQIIGVKTFGTFMPILVALSFKQTGLVNGVVFFTSIVIFGLVIRSYFHHLQLLLVPRLAGLLTIVVILISLIAMTAHNFDLNTGLSIALFPIVILTMTIERMTIMWDETGPKEAITAGLGSLLSATIGFIFINNETLEHLFFTFPELLLIILGLCMLLGRYNGYKLTEYLRFRKLNAEIERLKGHKPKKKKS